ncbi:hypothetical protein SDC9_156385 [bioreactor metagenome]|uniref:Uncharacterized protein n=1 Tax=bioreactor metagenome TaxID=1076179 RepID=A0A645F4K5_9ZZZZ
MIQIFKFTIRDSRRSVNNCYCRIIQIVVVVAIRIGEIIYFSIFETAVIQQSIAPRLEDNPSPVVFFGRSHRAVFVAISRISVVVVSCGSEVDHFGSCSVGNDISVDNDSLIPVPIMPI